MLFANRKVFSPITNNKQIENFIGTQECKQFLVFPNETIISEHLSQVRVDQIAPKKSKSYFFTYNQN